MSNTSNVYCTDDDSTAALLGLTTDAMAILHIHDHIDVHGNSKKRNETVNIGLHPGRPKLMITN